MEVPKEVPAEEPGMPDMAELDKIMQELFSSGFGGGGPGGAGGAPPDISGLTKLLG
jgi:hypothetical protein